MLPLHVFIRTLNLSGRGRLARPRGERKGHWPQKYLCPSAVNSTALTGKVCQGTRSANIPGADDSKTDRPIKWPARKAEAASARRPPHGHLVKTIHAALSKSARTHHAPKSTVVLLHRCRRRSTPFFTPDHAILKLNWLLRYSTSRA